MTLKSQRILCRQTCSFVLVLLTTAAAPLRAQSPPQGTLFNQASNNLGSILQTSAQKVLSTCQSWPPRLAKKPSDQNKGPDNRDLVDGSNVITTQLASVLNIDPTVKPYVYDASFLRMLDSVGTFNPGIPNLQLLGIALHVDPSQLQLWGTNTSTVKYDCLSLLSLAGKAGANYSIPFFSLNAAFQASQSASANQTSTFFFGTLQSPFDYMFNSADQSQRLFALLKALEWRLNNGDPDSGQDQYVATAQFFTVDRGYTASESSSFLGNMKAGVNFPLVNLSGSVTGQYTSSLQANSSSYVTYFWQQHMKRIPDLGTLGRSVANSLPELVPTVRELSPGSTPVKVTASVTGWPDELCFTGAWTLGTKNQNFSVADLTMSKAAAVGALPVCTITAAFLFPGPAPKLSSDLANPQLYLVNATNSNVSITLPVSGAFHFAGATSATVQPATAKWIVMKDSNNQNTYLYWTVSGVVDLPNGRVIKSTQVRLTDFACKAADGSTLPFTDVQLEGTAPSTPQVKTSSDSNFTTYVLLSLLGVTSFDADANQANKRTCVINGVVRVTTTDFSGANSLNESANFKTTPIYYPNELEIPGVPTNLSATSGTAQVSLAWNSSATATAYNIYRGIAPSTEVLAKSGVKGTSYLDTALVSGTTYYYKITAINSVGESPLSNETSVTPH